MPIEAVKIPQNVYVEDHIVGPVTMRQLLITGVGAGIGYGIFAMAQKAGVTNIIALGACWIPTVISAAFAFLKINDLSLFSIILLTIEGLNKPSTRYWSSHSGLSINLITKQTLKKAEEAEVKANTNIEKIADITRQMEKREQELQKLSLHGMPSPKNVEGITTQLENNATHGLYEHEQEDIGESKPVRREKIQATGLQKDKSIDSVTNVIHDVTASESFSRQS